MSDQVSIEQMKQMVEDADGRTATALRENVAMGVQMNELRAAALGQWLPLTAGVVWQKYSQIACWQNGEWVVSFWLSSWTAEAVLKMRRTHYMRVIPPAKPAK